jgi:hypothetical protein
MTTTAAKTPKPKIIVIDKSISTDSQDVRYYEIISIDGKKLKMEIRSNSFKHQCHAYVYSLEDTGSGIKWNIVHSIAATVMKTPEKLCYKSGVTDYENYFTADRNDLVRVASALLN